MNSIVEIIIMIYSVNQISFADCLTPIEELKLALGMTIDDIHLIKQKVWLEMSYALDTLDMKVGKLENISKCSTVNHTESTLSTNVTLLEKQLSAATNDAEKLKDNVTNIYNSLNELQFDMNRVKESLQLKPDKSVNKMQKPTFVSEWILMRAQDADLAERTVAHGLGTLPYKVDVQIRPTSGPNAGWIFSGDRAVQSDDDLEGEAYGGVVFFYDEMNVYLTTPKKSNNYGNGVIINTGASKQRRIGNNHQISQGAYVRVKVWAPSDLPEPDMKSEWFPLDITNESLSYYEIPHGLNNYPGLVNVQIRCSSSDEEHIISEGVGTFVPYRRYSNAGGVVHAFNEDVVRLWTGHLRNTTDNFHFRLAGGFDGWKTPSLDRYNKGNGQFRVLAWLPSNVTRAGSVFEQHEYNKDFAEWSAFDKFSSDTDLFSFYVQANGGANKGFRFPGYGNSQSTLSPFGGAVYAYHPNGEVRIWRPNPTKDGHLVFIKSPYGNGVNEQASNDAHYVSTLLRAN